MQAFLVSAIFEFNLDEAFSHVKDVRDLSTAIGLKIFELCEALDQSNLAEWQESDSKLLNETNSHIVSLSAKIDEIKNKIANETPVSSGAEAAQITLLK